jgi:hypothetical protein
MQHDAVLALQPGLSPRLPRSKNTRRAISPGVLTVN